MRLKQGTVKCITAGVVTAVYCCRLCLWVYGTISGIQRNIITAAKPEQVTDSMECLKNFAFSENELNVINLILQ